MSERAVSSVRRVVLLKSTFQFSHSHQSRRRKGPLSSACAVAAAVSKSNDVSFYLFIYFLIVVQCLLDFRACPSWILILDAHFPRCRILMTDCVCFFCSFEIWWNENMIWFCFSLLIWWKYELGPFHLYWRSWFPDFNGSFSPLFFLILMSFFLNLWWVCMLELKVNSLILHFLFIQSLRVVVKKKKYIYIYIYMEL